MSRSVSFTDIAWEDYQSWTKDKKTLKKVNDLIKEVQRNPTEGTGKPEALSGDLAGFWSRKINEADRLVYEYTDKVVNIIQGRKQDKDH